MKKFLLLFAALVGILNLSAQKREITIREYFADAEFFLVQEEYPDALSDYLEVYKRGYDNNANINYRIGICYLNIPGQKERSIQYLEKAATNASEKYRESSLNETHAPLDVYLYLGNAYRVNYQLDTAVARYKHYLELIEGTSREEIEYVEKQIEGCYIAKEYILNPRRVIFNNLGKIINNNNANYNAIISGDGNTLMYMTKLPFYEGVFMSRKRGANWSRPVNITPQIMSDGDQVVTGISHDGNTILLAKADAFNSDIYISYFENGQWKRSKSVSKNINTKYWESHASFSADGKKIYFTSNRKGGMGAMDIYVSEMNEDGDWGEAVNLGEKINTPLNEDTPFITQDGKILYFASQGHRNIGGYDFFMAEYADTAWVNPQNLQFPISTTDEDLFYFPIGNGETALVHKIIEDGYGVYDIYEVTYPTDEEIEEAIAEQIEEDAKEEIQLEVSETSEPIIIEIEPILFGFDRAELSKEAITQLDFFVQILSDNEEAKITITGYTDALGPEEYNQQLSLRRAQKVALYFYDKGIEKSRIISIGKGETDFIAVNKTPQGNDNPDGRKYNRRVEFDFSGLNNEWYTIRKVNIVPENLSVQTQK